MANYARINTGTAFQSVMTAAYATANGNGLTSVTINLSDGSTLVVAGSGLSLVGGALTAGTINSLTHVVAGGGSNIETITGLSYSAATFQSFLTPAVNGTGLYNAVMGLNDDFFGSSNADSLIGAGGNDFLRGLAGNDTLDGGGGIDMAGYALDSSNGGAGGVIVNLTASSLTVNGNTVASGTARDGFGNTDTLIGIEEARGTAQADYFAGGTILNGAGYVLFQGRGGADTYVGGASVAWRVDNSGGTTLFGPSSAYFTGVYWVDYREDGGSVGINITLTDGTGGVGGTTGGSGTDTFGAAETFTNISHIRASMFADTIIGNNYFNLFQGLQGNDTINGGGGYDTVDYSRDSQFGGTGAVTVNLATGVATDGFGNTDTFSNIERAFGTGGNDSLVGNAWDNRFQGFNGDDTLIGGDGFDDLRPGLGVDLVDGAPGANGDQSHDDRDRLGYHSEAPDSNGLGVIVNLSASSVIFEGLTVAGSSARDPGGSLDTLVDIERVRGTSGRDYFVGSATANLREELFEGSAGNDYIDGGAGFDLLSYVNEVEYTGGTSGVIVNASGTAITIGGNTVASGTARDSFGNTDTFFNIEGIIGTALADYYAGSSGYDFFRGQGGADTFDGAGGDFDRISFLADDLTYGTTGAGAVVDMVAGTATTWLDGNTTTFLNVEDVTGSERNDLITGNAIGNNLSGDSGADTINGGAGNDTITGGLGSDSLNGGADFDIVNYSYDPTFGSFYVLQRSWEGTTAWGGVNVNLLTGIAVDQAGFTDSIAGFEGVTGTFRNDTLTGDDGDNLFRGLSGNDTIDGGFGIDTVSYAGWGARSDGSNEPILIGLNASRPNGVNVNLSTGVATDGEGGTDTLIRIENVIGSVGNDLFISSDVGNAFDGGDGIDTVSYVSATGTGIVFYMLAANLNGGNSAGDICKNMENLIGTLSNDRIYMDNGNNSVEGAGGEFDTAELYAGNDGYLGGSGFDYVLAGAGNDVISVGGGGSLIYGEDGNDTIVAASGSNSLYGGAGFDSITGGSNTDVLFGGTDGDTINGGDGNDFIFGEDGADSILGGIGGDQIVGGEGADTINGDAGVDVILGGTGNDSISGGTEDDFLFGEAGDDTISGGTGVDQIQGGIGNDFLNGDVGGDVILAGDDNDTISGGADGDFLFGELGADSLNGDDGADQLFGGDGNDTINGGLGIDVIFGDDGDDSLSGGSELGSVNFMLGGNGNDTIAGGVGQDQMWGGTGSLDTGNDVFVIGASGGFDIIFDFQAGAALGDRISLAGTGFTSFTQLVTENRISQAGSYTHIALGGGNDVFLAGVTAASMVSNDFIF
jgi:Ca2+-binding RTX toxin-like protein